MHPTMDLEAFLFFKYWKPYALKNQGKHSTNHDLVRRNKLNGCQEDQGGLHSTKTNVENGILTD